MTREDYISRQAVIDLIEHYNSDGLGSVFFCYEEGVKFADAVNKLSPVTPQQKTGHWILADEQNKEDIENDNYRFICSECQCSDIHAKGIIVPYCWKCGTKMVEPQESEEVCS